MKSYWYLFLAVIVAFLLGMSNIGIFSLDEMSVFLTVIGLVYGLIAAFTINNAWERFSKIRDLVAEELNSLELIHDFAAHMSDKASFKKLREAIIRYCREAPKIEWHEYWKSTATHRKFKEILEIVYHMTISTERDAILYDTILDEVRDASSSRSTQLVLARTRISKIQWILNLFLSTILIAGLVLLSIPNAALSIFIVGSMIAAIFIILIVIYELDSMKFAEEEVSIAPYQALVRLAERAAVK